MSALVADPVTGLVAGLATQTLPGSVILLELAGLFYLYSYPMRILALLKPAPSYYWDITKDQILNKVEDLYLNRRSSWAAPGYKLQAAQVLPGLSVFLDLTARAQLYPCFYLMTKKYLRPAFFHPWNINPD
ncbi:hypothetical protein [Paraburkholderia hayleyella]|uniref:hypothetical protein n=1 Tax=Paraburkholderia hayleyella TaxID=2152889 RepID=UPI001290A952|nr:hypothetical protein [Paraburkholderia hayleyella]